MKSKVLVTGAGGFIAHHLSGYLVQRGYNVRGVDIKKPEFEPTSAQEFFVLDLRNKEACEKACEGVDEVYHLAADMGGIGYITGSHAEIAKNNTMINVHMLEAARKTKVKRFLFSSTACVYPMYLQKDPDISPLREDQAYPADPEEGYGWEKLYMEKLCEYYHNDFGLETRIVRFHNVYGPLGTYEGGKEKAPAAVCRKIALAKQEDVIDVWGDGNQTRSFMYVDDCTEGMHRLMRSDFSKPLNLGREDMVTINELVDIVSKVAGKKIEKRHDRSKPQGVRGRNSDNTLIRQVLSWEPSIPLEVGLLSTYQWIATQIQKPETKPTRTTETSPSFATPR